MPPPWAEAPAQQPSPPSPKIVNCTAAQCNRVVKADPPAQCFACDERPLCALNAGQLSEDCQRDSGDPVVEAAPGPAVKVVAMSAEGAEGVDEDLWTQKIVEEDLCGFAALVMMHLDQTVLYTIHRPGPLAAEISADVSSQPCAPRRLSPWPLCPRGGGVGGKLYILCQKRNQKVSMQTDRGWEIMMMVTNGGGGGVLVGLPRCHRLGADRGHGKQNSMGGISSKCVYSHLRLCTRRL